MQDNVISTTEITGQGKWTIETVYEGQFGNQYIVWSDSTGETWYKDLYKDLADN